MMKCNEPTGAYTAPEIRLEQIAVESGFATSDQVTLYDLDYENGITL